MSAMRMTVAEGRGNAGTAERPTTGERVVRAFQRDPLGSLARALVLMWGGFWTWFGASVLAGEWKQALGKGAVEFQAWFGSAWPGFLTVALVVAVTAAALKSRAVGAWALAVGGVAAVVFFRGAEAGLLMAMPQFVIAGLLAASLWRERR